jgi:cob(I)alamin adenosyltransferase
VSKSDQRVEACGAVDELNAVLGVLISLLPKEAAMPLEDMDRIQSDLFHIGAILATTFDSPTFASLEGIDEKEIKFLERAVDRMEEELVPLRAFILPRGHLSAAWAHVARTVCRRAERRMIGLAAEGPADRPGKELRTALVFMNRLSDYLFVVARYCNKKGGMEEKIWGQ